MSTVYGELRAQVKAGYDAEQAAKRTLAKLRKADLAAFLAPLLTNEARRFVRADTRELEAETFARLADGEDPISVRRKLAESSFVLPSGEYVGWLEATAEQHLARAGWQRGHARACIADAERHEAAAEAIRTAGVSCLAEIEEAA